MAALFPDPKADTFNTAAIPIYQGQPKPLCQTLTLDNGKELSHFKDLKRQTGLSVYFADPYQAWQWGRNENTNGLLRVYFPRGAYFKRISDKALQSAIDRMNSRPGKCLNYQTLQKVFDGARNGGLVILIHPVWLRGTVHSLLQMTTHLLVVMIFGKEPK